MGVITRIRRSTQGISPTISVLLMIAIAVAASLVAYAWIMGYIGGTTTKSGKAILIQSIAGYGGNLVVYVQNVGIGDVRFDPDACVYVDDVLRTCTVDGSGEVVTAIKGQTVKMLADYAVTLDVRMKIKVVTLEGVFSEITDSISGMTVVYDIVASAGTGGTIMPSGTVPVTEGGSKTFTISANVGWHILDVVVDGGSQGVITEYTFADVHEDHTIAASFSQNEYMLTINVVGNGHVDADPPTGPYHFGDSVELTAVADLGWSFSKWEGDVTGSVNPAVVIIDETPAVTATFTQDQYTLTVTPSGSGSVSKNPDKATYTYGEIVQLTANPQTGWSFSVWGGDLSGSVNPTDIVMNGNKAVTATFTINSYTLSVGYAGTGTGTVDLNPPGGTYTHGTIVTLTANATADSVFKGWSGALSGTTNPEHLTMDEPKTVTAIFNLKKFTVTFAAAGLDGDATGTVVTVNGTAKTPADLSPPYEVPANDGDNVVYSYEGTVAGGAGKQFVLTGVTGPTSPVSGPATITGNYQTQYYLTVDSDYGSTSGEGWYNSGAMAHAGLDISEIDHGNGTKHVFESWGTDASGTNYAQSNDITMNGPKTATANWKTQYYLTVNSAYGTTGGAGWYDSDATAYATVTPLTVPGPTDTQYLFTQWTGDASGTTSPSDPITMNAPKTATANWQTQYYLTVSSAYGTPSGQGWYNSGAMAHAGLDISEIDHGNGTKHVFESWGTDASGTNYLQSDAITMSGPKTATANWKTQYYLTVNSAHGTVGGAGWYDSGATAYATVTPLTVPGPTDTQYLFTQWTGDASGTTSPSDPITMNAPKTATANWKTQYRVQFAANPPAGGSTSPSAPTWYDAGATGVSISASVNSGYGWTGWTAPGAIVIANPSSLSTTATINGPGTITANFYMIGYTLIVNVGGSGSVTKDPDLPIYNSGTVVQLTAVPANGWRFTGWSGDLGGSENPKSILMDGNKAVTASFATGTETSIWWLSWPEQITIGNEYSALGQLTSGGSGLFGEQIVLTFTKPDGTKIVSTTTTFWFILNGLFYAEYTPDALGQWAVIAQFLGDETYGAYTTEPRTFMVVSEPMYEVEFRQNGIPEGLTTVVTYHIDSGPDQQDIVPFKVYVPQSGEHTITYSYQDIVPGAEGVRYFLTSANPVTTPVTTNRIITDNYKTQYYVNFPATPSAGGTINRATGWFDASPPTLSITATPNSGYIFTSWTTTGSITLGSTTNPSTTATLNGPGTITANFALAPHYVDTNNPVHDIPNVGSHSSFPNMQNDGSYDTLTESDVGGTPIWVTPTGDSDSGSSWSNRGNAHDGSTATRANAATGLWSWCSYLQLSFPSTTSTAVNYFVGRENSHVANMQIQVYTTSWQTVYSGAPTLDTWTTVSFSSRTITSVRIRFQADNLGGGQAYVYEVQVQSTPINYQLDLEVQFSGVTNYQSYTQLQIKTGTLSAENIAVYYWSGGSWQLLTNALTANTVNTFTVNLSGETFDLRFIDTTRTGDTTQNTWQIDYVRLVAP